LISAVVATGVTAILLPAIELVWNFGRAPLRVALDEIQRLKKDNEVLQRQLEASTGYRGIARAKLQEFWDRGAELKRAILDDSDDTESAHQRWWAEFQKWREEALDYLQSLSQSKAAYVDEVKVAGTPITHKGIPLVQWKQDLIKQIDARLERLNIVMQDYPGGVR